MTNFKRCSVVFNLDSPDQRDLHEWVHQQTSNFSGYVRMILFAHKQSLSLGSVAEVSHPEVSGYKKESKPFASKDAEAMSGLI